MGEILFTTKKTNMAYLIYGIIESLIFAGIGIYFLSLRDNLISAWNYSAAETMQTCSTVFLILAAVNVMYKAMSSATFADVYNDKIVGKGIQKLAFKEFDLDYQQISDISVSHNYLSINTAAGTYKVVASQARSKEIFAFYNHKKTAG